MRTRVTKSFSFDAAHALPWHPGKCRQLHGHTYRVEVSVDGPVGAQGVVVDFADVDGLVQGVLARYDHAYLNDFIDNPTAEIIAAGLWKELEEAGFGPTVRLAGLRLWETPDCSVELLP